jgi:hypothetical protein
MMAVAEWAETLVDWREALAGAKQVFAPVFKRVERRASAGAFIDGLLSRAERKTGWILSEEAGHEGSVANFLSARLRAMSH